MRVKVAGGFVAIFFGCLTTCSVQSTHVPTPCGKVIPALSISSGRISMIAHSVTGFTAQPVRGVQFHGSNDACTEYERLDRESIDGGLDAPATFFAIAIGGAVSSPTGRFTIRPPGSNLNPDGAEAQLKYFAKGHAGLGTPDVAADVVQGMIDVTVYDLRGLTYDGRNGGGRFAGHFDFTFADGARLSADFDTPFCRYICP